VTCGRSTSSECRQHSWAPRGKRRCDATTTAICCERCSLRTSSQASTQDPSTATALPEPVLHRLDHASFAWRTESRASSVRKRLSRYSPTEAMAQHREPAHCLASIRARFALIELDIPFVVETAAPRPEDQLVRLAERFHLLALELSEKHPVLRREVKLAPYGRPDRSIVAVAQPLRQHVG